MPDYVKISQKMRNAFLEEADNLERTFLEFFLFAKSHPKPPPFDPDKRIQQFASLREKINRLEIKPSTSPEDDKKNYDLNFIEFYLGYQNFFNRLAFLSYDPAVLKALGYDDKEQENIKDEIRSIQRRTLETVFFHKEPVSSQTIQKESLSHRHINNIINDPNQGIFTLDTQIGLYSVHVISLANAYAEKTKTMSGDFWTPKNVFWNVQNEIIPLNDCISRKDHHNLFDTQTSVVNKVLDRFSRVKTMGDYICEAGKFEDGKSILNKSIKILRNSGSLFSPFSGNFYARQCDIPFIVEYKKPFYIVAGDFKDEGCFMNDDLCYIYPGRSNQQVILNLEHFDKHVYVYTIQDNKAHMDVFYSGRTGDYQSSIYTYPYKNNAAEDYVIYESQLDGWKAEGDLMCISPNRDDILTKDDDVPGNMRFNLPSTIPSLLIQQVATKKVIHFLNLSHPDTLAAFKRK